MMVVMDPAPTNTPSIRDLKTVGAIVVIVAGTLLHFTYEWLGGNRFVGL